jgi:hypothetical protein
MKRVQPSLSQKEILRQVLLEDTEILGISSAVGHGAFEEAAVIVVRQEFDGAIPDNLAHGLPPGPPVTGAPVTAVDNALATAMARFLAVETRASLHVPLPLAIPSELEKLRGKFGDRVYELKGRVWVRFSGREVDPELIRRSLATMLGAYSVAWLVVGPEIHSRPITAFVSVFDGEGWAVLGDGYGESGLTANLDRSI